MYPIDGVRSSLEVLLGRLSGSNVDKFVLATGASDGIYQDLARALDWDVFASGYVRDENVLERLWRATLGWYKIVIVHGDSPLINAGLVNRALDLFHDLDVLACSGPSGFSVRVLKGQAMGDWYRWVLAQAEHPLSGLLDPPGLAIDRFHLGPCEERFTIDEYPDVQFIRGLCSQLGPDKEPEAYISYLRDHPDFRKGLSGRDTQVGGFTGAA
jgi:Spore coat polysaccharide biosynthesis protein F, CMP-KDO synthetase homolog